jgi:hypothetical protein
MATKACDNCLRIYGYRTITLILAGAECLAAIKIIHQTLDRWLEVFINEYV